MTYGTILVHLDDTRQAPERVAIAARLCLVDHSYLIGAASTGMLAAISHSELTPSTLDEGTDLLEHGRASLRSAVTNFDSLVRKLGISGSEWRLVPSDGDETFSQLARHCGLAVLGQAGAHDATRMNPAHLLRSVLLNSGRPVLVVPHSGHFATVGGHPLMTWDGSAGAARALAEALPVLRHAALVDLVICGDASHDTRSASQSRVDIALHMTRHDVRVRTKMYRGTGPMGPALLDIARELGSDLIVMGAGGYQRLHKIVLDEVTRYMLDASKLPLFMMH